MWTTHGYQIIGTIALDPHTNNRPAISRCGGPANNCQHCIQESVTAQKALGLDEFGNEPVLEPVDGSSEPARILGRVLMALMRTRPMSEAEAISDRLSTIVAEHKVLMELHDVDPETLKNLPKPG